MAVVESCCNANASKALHRTSRRDDELDSEANRRRLNNIVEESSGHKS
jgi:hypothetical protein